MVLNKTYCMLTRLSTDARLSFGTLTGEPWGFWLNTFSTASLESDYMNINIYLSITLIELVNISMQILEQKVDTFSLLKS